MQLSTFLTLAFLLIAAGCKKEKGTFFQIPDGTFSFKSSEMTVEVDKNRTSFTLTGLSSNKNAGLVKLYIDDKETTAIEGVQYIRRFDYKFIFDGSEESTVSITIFPEKIDKEVRLVLVAEKGRVKPGGIGKIEVNLIPKQ